MISKPETAAFKNVTITEQQEATISVCYIKSQMSSCGFCSQKNKNKMLCTLLRWWGAP